MAQRKSPSGGKPVAKKGTARPGDRPPSGSAGRPPARNQPPRKPGKSIVNQKQTPWGVIASIAAVVVFAAAVVIVVIATHKSGNSNSAGGGGAQCSGQNAPYCQPEVAAAKQIPGVIHKIEPKHTHVTTPVKYDTSPPTGGDHSAYWADCNGTVYPNPIANENAVHPLEHGAIWVTYRQGLPQSEVSTLAQNVTGKKYVFMSPYPNLKTKVSLQAWGYQLFLNSVTDPRINEFLALSQNPKITPEPGASCDQPTFKQRPSTFGHPLWAPASGGAGNTMP